MIDTDRIYNINYTTTNTTAAAATTTTSTSTTTTTTTTPTAATTTTVICVICDVYSQNQQMLFSMDYGQTEYIGINKRMY